MKRERFNKILVCVCLILCMMPQLLNAQRKKPWNLPNYDNEPYHYGFIIGYNQMLFSTNYIDNFQNTLHNPSELPSSDVLDGTTDAFLNSPFRVDEINPEMTHGFTVGIVGNLRLARNLDLRLIPSLSFGERKITYTITSIQEDPIDGSIVEVSKLIPTNTHSTFVEFPLHIKVRSNRNQNTSAYVIAGANYKIDMASQKKFYDESGSKPKPKTLVVNRHDIAAEIGAGFDFYTGYFKLGIELKMSYGLLDIAKDHDFVYTSSFDSLRNKTFQLSFTFE